MELQKQWNDMVQVLQSSYFREKATSFIRTSLIEIANEIGPKMRLIHWQKLSKLKRIPHSSEGHAIDALKGIQSFGAPVCEVFMVSHRWLRPSLDSKKAHPDSIDNKKANAINEFSEWRRQWVKKTHQFSPEIFYWLDYSCIDQENSMEEMVMLPLWVACCERFLRIESPDYDSRAWCCLEPILSHVFSLTDHQTIINSDYKCSWPSTGKLTERLLLDPKKRDVTNPKDLDTIVSLLKLTTSVKPVNQNHKKPKLDSTKIKCFIL